MQSAGQAVCAIYMRQRNVNRALNNNYHGNHSFHRLRLSLPQYNISQCHKIALTP